MEARQPSPDRLPPSTLRIGAVDQAAATLDVLRSWAANDPAYDRETWALLERSFHEEPLSLSCDDDHVDRPG